MTACFVSSSSPMKYHHDSWNGSSDRGHMLLKIGHQPDHDFSEPLGLLSDCHRRIEHFLAVLTAIANQVQGAELTDAQRAQVDSAATYFTTAAPRHTADEEDSLFPRLRASRDPRAVAALDLVNRLESDHVLAHLRNR